jgi:hypothetical protein
MNQSGKCALYTQWSIIQPKRVTKIISFAGSWMELEITRLIEIFQTQTNITFSLICGIWIFLRLEDRRELFGKKKWSSSRRRVEGQMWVIGEWMWSEYIFVLFILHTYKGEWQMIHCKWKNCLNLNFYIFKNFWAIQSLNAWPHAW